MAADLVDITLLPELLKLDRRAIEEISQIRLISDFQWISPSKCFAQLIEINVGNSDNKYFPAITRWYITCGKDYPNGDIKVLPASDGGVFVTFPHQELIEEIKDIEVPWLNGHICISGEFASITRTDPLGEPRGAGRLGWTYQRAVQWCIGASKNQLFQAGDRFELPAIRNGELDGPFIITGESDQTFQNWKNTKESVGFLFGNQDSEVAGHFIRAFTDFKYNKLVEYNWNFESKADADPSGLWFLLKDVPVIAAWHTPRRWNELGAILAKEHLEINEKIRKFLPTVGIDKAFIIAIGFQFPKIVGSSPERVWWYFCKVPPLVPKGLIGFRNKSHRELGIQNFNALLMQAKEINWLSTRNFDHERLFSRGSIGLPLRNKKILLIGSGAVGSMLAEQLVRGGCNQIEITDSDRFDIGNLSRHTLIMKDLFRYKSKSLAQKLKKMNPFVSAVGKVRRFESYSIEELKLFDLIIDCTGDDEVIEALKITDGLNCNIVSLSIGYEAKRGYLCITKKWNPRVFYQVFGSFIKEDLAEIKKNAPDEGMGCWHYAFPADHSAILSHTSLAVRIIEKALEKDEIGSYLLERGETAEFTYSLTGKKLT